MDKENVFLQTISNIIQRLTKIIKVLTTDPRGKWISESLKIAMDAVEKGIISLWGVNKFWGILVISLSDHLYGKTKSRKIGSKGH